MSVHKYAYSSLLRSQTSLFILTEVVAIKLDVLLLFKDMKNL